MFVGLLVALQVAGPPHPGPEKLWVARSCAKEADPSDDIVVCGRVDQEQFRLRPLRERTVRLGIPRAETKVLGDLRATAEVEQSDVGGFPSNRLMLRLKLPF